MKNINIGIKNNTEVNGLFVPPNSRLKLEDKNYIIEYSEHSIFRNARISNVIGNINNVMSRLFYLLKEVENYIISEIETNESFVLHDKVLEINFVLKKEENKIILVTLVDVINKNFSSIGIKLFEGEKVISIDNTTIDYFIFQKSEFRKKIDII